MAYFKVNHKGNKKQCGSTWRHVDNYKLSLIRHALLTTELQLKTMERLHSHFILFENHQKSISMAPKLEYERL